MAEPKWWKRPARTEAHWLSVTARDRLLLLLAGQSTIVINAKMHLAEPFVVQRPNSLIARSTFRGNGAILATQTRWIGYRSDRGEA